MAEKCKCPVLDASDSYFAGFIEADLAVNRRECPGGFENEIGQLVCPAMVEKQETYANIMRPVSDSAENFLRQHANDKEQ